MRKAHLSLSTLIAANSTIEVGRAVASSKLSRSSIFLTTKYMPPASGPESTSTVYDKIRQSLGKSDQVSKQGEAYIDLYLVHAPRSGEEARKNNWACG